MKKLSILAAATFALALGGCANTSKAHEADESSNEEAVWRPYDERAREDREGAPTVYDGEVSGDSGQHSKVTTPDGQTWDTTEEPGGDEPKTPATKDSEEATGGSGDVKQDEVKEDVEIIDEGPTDQAPQE
ncbi:hypothetical protein BO221_41180 [Archangium sp. Cb G35]|uniref:hypothetical protein n=1 Tax=Archangium sp. Cb G35 TaxID=1920190 RepID=UPI000936DEFD|nr:hypothetical protein [Archangium sp. Cb G35]OJT18474.1 hypothetical protein BO221_41180 [Archangium sp. Cb G35]